MSLLGPNGQPINSKQFAKSAGDKKPLIGNVSSAWTGNANRGAAFSLENTLQFDTSRLGLNDFRMMRDHYQVNSSLTVLTFMLHQLEWKVECDNVKIEKFVTDNLERIWTRLVRALSQAFWAGFSPNVLDWENEGSRLVISKIKDLRPEEAFVNWKEVPAVAAKEGMQVATPKVKIYDGIKQPGYPNIPVSNSLWYPLMMENGDYYGKKLLKAAYQPWFFSNLIHFYSNRYFERFGEPVVVSRAPFDEKVDIGGNGNTEEMIQGNILMAGLNNMVRNGSSVVLPNSQAQNGLDGVKNYEYTMEYLESQMRGADFERYLTRLDQEISLALFTPLLMMNTADGGSFNLGVVHTQMYLGMLNAVASDWKEYIDRYILRPLAIHNFGKNAKIPRLKFRKLGATDNETVRTILGALLRDGNGDKSVKVDLGELGQEVGLTLTEIAKVTEEPLPAPEPGDDDSKPQEDKRMGRPERAATGKGTDKKGVALAMADRVSAQFLRQLRDEVPESSFTVDLGHSRQAREVMSTEELSNFQDAFNGFVGEYYGIQLRSNEPLESEIKKIVRNGILVCAGVSLDE